MTRLALLLALAACTPPDGDGAANRLTAAMATADTVDLAAVAPFDWDRVVIVGPYTTADRFEAQSGIDWPGHWDWSSVEVLDNRQGLVFAREGVAVAAFDYVYSEGIFAPAALPPDRYAPLDPTGFARDRARFVARQDPGGWRVWVPGRP